MNARVIQKIPRCTSPSPLQTKLVINKPGDIYEQEADRVAGAVMRMRLPSRAAVGLTRAQNVSRRKCAECEEGKEKNLRQKNSAGASTASEQNLVASPLVRDALRSGGRPLDSSTREFMESRFNYDFSHVRIHADRRAAASARSINALAYTVGRDVVFGRGQFSPYKSEGRKLLAHELAHVVQQSETTNGAAVVQRQTGMSPVLTQPSVAGISLPTKSVEFDAAETISATNPKVVELISAYKAAGFGATIKLSADFTEAAQLSSAKQKDEATQLMKRLHAVRDALTAGGVPADQVSIWPPTAFSTSAKGQVSADVMQGTSGSGLFPSTRPIPTLTPSPTVVPPATTTPSKSLSEMLSFKFKAGGAEFAIDLPKSATAKLPVALRAGKALAFELKAETSGTFSFSVTLDGLPHVRVRLEAQASVSKEKGTTGSAGLVIETTRTVCHAPSPESLKADITKAGDDLKKALQEAQAATKNEDKLSKLVDVASAIGDMYDAVDKAKKSCKQEPAATFKFGVQGPLSPPSGAPEETDPSKRPAPYIGGSITFHF